MLIVNNQYCHGGYLYAMVAAILFGASVPTIKLFIDQLSPWLVAGLLYLGAAAGVLIVLAGQQLFKIQLQKEASLSIKDCKWLGCSILFGGILGPICLMFGLAQTAATTTSLLLNLEAVFTALIAWCVFKEFAGRRIILGMLCIVMGSMVLSWQGNINLQHFLGPLLITVACLAWGLDNNVTRKISAANPLQISGIKSLVAGIINTVLAMLSGATFPIYKIIFVVGAIGFVGYGLSIFCFVLALRHIGAARTSAYFSLAPFVGAGLAILFLHEQITLQLIDAALLMGLGIWLHLTEEHVHEHKHEAMEHAHRHVHDEHHQHEHLPTDPPGEPHSHWHRHAPLKHTHRHFPDIHHRHKH